MSSNKREFTQLTSWHLGQKDSLLLQSYDHKDQPLDPILCKFIHFTTQVWENCCWPLPAQSFLAPQDLWPYSSISWFRVNFTAHFRTTHFCTILLPMPRSAKVVPFHVFQSQFCNNCFLSLCVIQVVLTSSFLFIITLVQILSNFCKQPTCLSLKQISPYEPKASLSSPQKLTARLYPELSHISITNFLHINFHIIISSLSWSSKWSVSMRFPFKKSVSRFNDVWHWQIGKTSMIYLW